MTRFTLDDQIACVRGEIGMRRRVYPGRVASGRMSQKRADHEVACMEAVLETLTALRRPSREQVRQVLEEVEALDLPDGAHWALVHERLGLEYGEVFDMISEDPIFFGWTERQEA